jgi:hypothetical protein
MATQTVTGTGADIESDVYGYRSAESTFAFYGDFGGGTLTVEASFNGTDTIPVYITLKKGDGTILEITEDEIHTLSLGKCLIRYRVTGATAAVAVNIVIKD